MKRFPLSVAFLIVSGCLLSDGSAAEKVYTPPQIPPGASRPTVPAPREEWLERVQDKFDRTQGKHFDLVFDGDSITAGWEWQGRGQDLWNARYAKLNAFDFGISGDAVQHLLWRLRHGQLDGINPKMVVLMIGTNNLQADDPKQIAAGIKVVVDEYLKDAPNAKLLLLGVLPRGAKASEAIRTKCSQINTILAGYADGKRVTYLDIGPKFLKDDGTLNPDLFVPDLVHPSAKGYQVWVDAIQAQIEQVFPSGH